MDGPTPLDEATTFALTSDPTGVACAATDEGPYRLSTASGAGWTPVLQHAGPDAFAPCENQVTSVVVEPGSDGRAVDGVVGWRGPGDTTCNGFYRSTDGGLSLAEVKPSGAIDASDIGRTPGSAHASSPRRYSP